MAQTAPGLAQKDQKKTTSPAMPGGHTRSHWGRHCSTPRCDAPSRGTSPDQLLTKRSALVWWRSEGDFSSWPGAGST